MVRLLVIFAVLFSSCAVKEKSCPVIYKETLDYQNKLPEKYEAKGLFYIKNLPAIFKAEFSDEENIRFYTIFGQKLGSIKKKKNVICIDLPDISKCGDEEIIEKILKIKIPQKLKDILIGKIKISNNMHYYCIKDELVIEDNKIKYIFKNKKLVEIVYNKYKVEYEYFNEKTIVNIYSKDKLITKIEIKNIKPL